MEQRIRDTFNAGVKTGAKEALTWITGLMNSEKDNVIVGTYLRIQQRIQDKFKEYNLSDEEIGIAFELRDDKE